MFSNRYIFTFSIIMVVIVAAVLSIAATYLKPYQEKNIMIEKMKGILQSADIQAEKQNMMETYQSVISKELTVDSDGNIVSDYENGNLSQGKQRAFDVDLNTLYNTTEGNQIKAYPLYVGNANGETIYIVPLRGKGLWGPIWGNIAFNKDMNTIKGATFGHKGETPGLGAEIETDAFGSQFQGKKIFDKNGQFSSVKVVKGGVANSKIEPVHGVDAISGGTITSNGVDEMIENNLKNYVAFFKKMQQNKNE